LLLLKILAAAAALTNSFSAEAADASAWDGDARSAVRLIAGSPITAAKARTLRAGIAVKLAAGWKTYWRYPGDSGIPPRFNFSRSENIQTVDVLWPAPHRFSDPGGQSIGYKDGIIFPLHIIPREPAKPVRLRLELEYAVCEKLCVPAVAKVELALDAGASSHDGELARSEAQVPKPTRIGDSGELAVKAVQRQASQGKSRIVIDVAVPSSEPIDVFAEGPTPDWALPLPEPVPGSPPGIKRFAFNLEGAPPGATVKGQAFKLTVVGGTGAIEASTHLD
jgi:DsbC/DsbD-like thiol-disulfide interchange protein